MLEGVRELNVGTGLGGKLMMKVVGFERPLLPAPEKGFWVMTVAAPGLATNAADITALTETMLPAVSRLSVVVSFFPFHSMKVLATKPCRSRLS